MLKRIAIIAVAVAAIAPQAFAGTDGEGFKTDSCELAPGAPLPGSGNTINVPADQPTIQAAVDAASAYDEIVIAPDEYTEAVHVPATKSFLRIRGTDRAGVVLNGENVRGIGINVDGADGVVIENMTAHNYLRHGFYWTEAHGYWARYLTAYNMGLYGIYAYDARCGQIDNSFTSGAADSGFYIGECFPCSAVITDSVAERNALGYSGTNAGGDLVLKDTIWRDNAMGIVPNSLDGEERPPQRGVIIHGNTIINNNNITAPGVSLAGTFYGVGIAIAGGNSNIVYGNTVTGHALAGIVLSPLPDENLWISGGNTVWGNTVTHDAEAYPDSYDLGQGAVSGPGNCWADNLFGTSSPANIEDIYSCDLPTTAPGGSPLVELGLVQGAAGLNGRAPSDWRDWPAPTASEAFVNMPGALTGPLTEWLPELL